MSLEEECIRLVGRATEASPAMLEAALEGRGTFDAGEMFVLMYSRTEGLLDAIRLLARKLEEIAPA